MGSNTGAREIASERIHEKERLNGLRPSAYALSKIFSSLIAVGRAFG